MKALSNLVVFIVTLPIKIVVSIFTFIISSVLKIAISVVLFLGLGLVLLNYLS